MTLKITSHTTPAPYEGIGISEVFADDTYHHLSNGGDLQVIFETPEDVMHFMEAFLSNASALHYDDHRDVAEEIDEIFYSLGAAMRSMRDANPQLWPLESNWDKEDSDGS